MPGATEGGDLRAAQLVGEIAAEGHAVTYVSLTPARRPEDISALRDAGWRAFAPSCADSRAAWCDECGQVQSRQFVSCMQVLTTAAHPPHQVQSRQFVSCRVQSASRLAHRVAVIDDDAHLAALGSGSSAVAAEADVVLLMAWFWRCGAHHGAAELAMQRLNQQQPVRHSRVVVVSDDVHWVRDASAPFCNDSAAIRVRELALYSSAALTLTITDEDRAKLSGQRRGLPLRTLPFAAMTPTTTALAAGWAQRRGVLFVGSYHRSGNTRALRWLLRRVWPKVRQAVPSARLNLVGAHEWRAEVCEL